MDKFQTDKSLAVLETEEHAAEVRACAEGKDMIEYPYATPGRAPSALTGGFQSGKDWESFRPLEVKANTPPWIRYGAGWHQQRGRFCAFSGLGARLNVLRARRAF